MAALDYATALARIPESGPQDLTRLLQDAAGPLGASEIILYLADFERVLLQPILLSPDFTDPIVADEWVSTSMAGRAFRTGEPVVAQRDGSVRVWVPVVEHADRTGVLAVDLPRLTDTLLADCVALGAFAGLLVRGFAPCTDLLHLRRQRLPMSLAAGIQWDLLPPLTAHCARGLACGQLQPAYEIAGDVFDYAVNPGRIEAALFDGMGHGVHATMLATLAMGAYRHARRTALPLPQAHVAIDEALSAEFGEAAFVTGVLVRLDLDSGVIEWTNAGHPLPLLLRGHKVVGELSCAPSLPFGLGEPCKQVAAQQLEPADSVLFFTDGVIEGRSALGEEFGEDRLLHLLEQHSASGQQPEEILRRLAQAIVEHNDGGLRDDATLLLVRWHGRGPGS